jgi:hypothetical protein
VGVGRPGLANHSVASAVRPFSLQLEDLDRILTDLVEKFEETEQALAAGEEGRPGSALRPPGAQEDLRPGCPDRDGPAFVAIAPDVRGRFLDTGGRGHARPADPAPNVAVHTPRRVLSPTPSPVT